MSLARSRSTFCWLTAALALGGSAAAAPSPPPEVEVAADLRHADTYLRFALVEENRVEVLERALAYAERAQSIAEGHHAAPWAPNAEATARTQVAELEAQLRFAREKLFGRFPLLHGLRGTLLSGRTKPGNFELFRRPDIAATEDMVHRLVELITERWSTIAQTDVVMMPTDPVLDAVALSEFNRSPKFWIHTATEVERALEPGGVAQLRSEPAPETAIARLRQQFRSTSLLVARIRRVDTIDRDHFFELTGVLTRGSPPVESHRLSSYGFARDARQSVWLVVGFNLAVLAAAVAAYVFLARRRRPARTTAGELILAGLVGFLAGRCSPWILIEPLERLEPPPSTPMVQGLWWPALLPAVVIIAPALVYRLLMARLRHRVPALAKYGRSDGATWLLLGCGGAAYLATTLLIHERADDMPRTLAGLAMAFAVCIAGGVGLHLIGRALDRSDVVPWWVAAAAFAALLGLGLSACSVPGAAIAAVTGVLVVGLAVVERRFAWAEVGDRSTPGDRQSAAEDSECAALIAACDRPPFWSNDKRQRAATAVSQAASGRAEWVHIRGKLGSGKSALADALVADFVERSGSAQTPEVLRVVAKQTREPRPPFEAFEAVLAQLGLSTEAPAEAADEDSERAIVDTLFGEFPFAHLLLGGGEDAAAAAPEQVRAVLVDVLRRLARRRPVAIVFEHANWLHPLSQEVISTLYKRVPRGSRLYLLGLVTETPTRKDAAPLAGAIEIDLPDPSEEQLHAILSGSIGLEPETARHILSESGEPPTGLGRLHWLLQVTRSLAVEGNFVPSAEGYRLRPEVADRPSLPIPQEMDDIFRAAFERAGGGRRVLECAACAGEEFDPRLIADALGESLLAVLESLRALGDESGLVAESGRGDLRYRFSSPQMRRAMLHWIGDVEAPVRPSGGMALAQAHHLALAAAWERRLADDPAAIYSVANHLHWAGAAAGSQGARRVFEAAQEALRRLDHVGARRFAQIAAGLAEANGTALALRELDLRITCSEAHVEGRDRRGAARVILDFVERGVDASWLLIAAQACYDAANETNDQELFARTVELGTQAIGLAAAPAARATGHLFAALGRPTHLGSERQVELRAGLALLTPNPSMIEERAARAKLENALAELLSFGPDAKPEEARRLFSSSIELKSSGGLMDLPGLARSQGGLGRLALFSDPPRPEEAERHLRLDLEISERLGDLVGVAQMHSMLGLCALARNPPAYDNALTWFEQSLEHASGARDRIFAQIGRLRALAALARWELADAAGRELADLLESNGIPRGAEEDLVRAIRDAAPGGGDKEWLMRLRALLGELAAAQPSSHG